MKNQLNRASASGHYKVAVVEAASDKVVWESPEWKPNLILTPGMDKKASLPWEDLFTHAAIGTGTTPNYISTGDTVWNHSWQDVTSDGVKNVNLASGSIVPGDALVVNDAVVVSITSGTSFLTDPSRIAFAGPWTNTYIAKASRTQLDSEVKRTNTWYTGWPYCGTVIEGPLVKMRRTFNFGIETAPTTYGEVGFTWSPNPAEPLFSRVVLDTPVLVNAGFYLRVFYELQVDHYPDVGTYLTIPLFSMSGAGGVCIQSFAGTCTSFVSTNGSSSGVPLVEGLEKGAEQWAFISDSQSVLWSFGTHWNPTEDGPTFAKVRSTKEPYRNSSFFFVRAATFTPGVFLGAVRLMGMSGDLLPGSWDQFYIGVNFDPSTDPASITLDTTDQLLLRWQYGWTRLYSDVP